MIKVRKVTLDQTPMEKNLDTNGNEADTGDDIVLYRPILFKDNNLC